MWHQLRSQMVAVAMVALLSAACSPAAPPPAPTKAPAPTSVPASAPTAAPKVAEPTKPAPAPTAVPQQPTQAPVKKAEFSVKGRPVTFIVPWGTGGPNDVAARLLAAQLDTDLGTPVQVVNKGGANSQIGLTELANAKPDGFTLGNASIPSVITVYLTPENKAVFGRQDLLPVALYSGDAMTVFVRRDSPHKTLKDVVDAAKANPGKMVGASSGLMSVTHLGFLLWEKAAGIQFATVQFNSAAEQVTAVLGGHAEVGVTGVGGVVPHFKSGELRILAIMDRQEDRFLPGVKTLESFGYKVYMGTSRGWSLPKATPQEIVDFWSNAIKKATDSGDFIKKMDAAGIGIRYMNSQQFGAEWVSQENDIKAIMEQLKKK